MEPEAAKATDAQEKDGPGYDNLPELNLLLFRSALTTISVTNVCFVHFWEEGPCVALAACTRASRARHRSSNLARVPHFGRGNCTLRVNEVWWRWRRGAAVSARCHAPRRVGPTKEPSSRVACRLSAGAMSKGARRLANLADIVAGAARPREIVIVGQIREIVVGIVLSRNVQSRKCDYEESNRLHTVDRWTAAFSVGMMWR